jgi:hypothetical protein
VYFRGSITRLLQSLSTLRGLGHPRTTQDSLLAAGQTLPDGIVYPQGHSERFQMYLHIILLSQAYPGATPPYTQGDMGPFALTSFLRDNCV